MTYLRNQQEVAPSTAKDAIAIAFKQLLDQYQQNEHKIATKEEEAEKEKNKELLEKTRNYTVNNIVNDLAALQLDFGGVINQLTNNLTTESNKLEELKKAIAVESKYLEQLNQVRLVADALHIFEQEHQEKIASLEMTTQSEKEMIEQEMVQVRKVWEREQVQFEYKVTAAIELITRQREAAAADYQYQLERQRTIEQDEYEENKRLQARELSEQQAIKNTDWQEREKYLADHQEEFIKNKDKINTFDAKLAEEYNQAKENAIKEVESKYKFEAELKEKDWSATKEGYQLKIESLSATIERQNQQITEINNRLQEVNTQAQNLARQAFQ